MNDFKIQYKTNNNVIYSCKYHIVWTPKYRKNVLIDDIAIRLENIIQEVANKYDSEIISLEIMPDHVHLLVEVDPQLGIHRLIKNIKGTTSRLLRNEFKILKTRLPTLWSNSYFCSTVGGAPLEIIKQYIENQKHV